MANGIYFVKNCHNISNSVIDIIVKLMIIEAKKKQPLHVDRLRNCF